MQYMYSMKLSNGGYLVAIALHYIMYVCLPILLGEDFHPMRALGLLFQCGIVSHITSLLHSSTALAFGFSAANPPPFVLCLVVRERIRGWWWVGEGGGGQTRHTRYTARKRLELD
jgi:hypothetical protein